MTNFHGDQAKKIQNGRFSKWPFFKIANSQKIFVKISWIGPWVSRIDWCKGIDVAQPIWPWDCSKQPKTQKMHFVFFCFIPMKICHKLCDRKNGTQFWCFSWFPANSLLCVILCYTVHMKVNIGKVIYAIHCIYSVNEQNKQQRNNIAALSRNLSLMCHFYSGKN